MNCCFLIFPFAYLYARQNFCASRIWNLLTTLSRFRIFSSRFVYVLSFCCPDFNDSEYMLWTKILALVTRSDFMYILCQHLRNGKIAAFFFFGSFLQPTKNLANVNLCFFVKFLFCRIITKSEIGLQILAKKKKSPSYSCSPVRPVISSCVLQTDVTKLVVAFRICFWTNLKSDRPNIRFIFKAVKWRLKF